ncbi:hypothetical protein A3D05_05125 [Candidatus Gottesmanbacteria bacterium RIFCSPHIGHO2_02_FULL_40_24]|uniref:Alanine--tRNA ligase n=1 Tax=Candidatus Gottesmanbacteria bacterium RIFCSPHIGHO2_01_FULL_40_15 TaxID=1798376 RepID=A0A1F5Z6P6_9BACT|nr:MAG: hypothetical protein A2777_01760 [Candidatus Gottesmanbacteria bacterium RIFCSPHIGHO2_01_FULL_40_15]OGG16413.1 MAG: hypothetical protein A3D05_05125 [Candidatus Gottesmanbacteria bacterium RIFCSPHIGHO2_02_FULL_40_24]OGG25527.1 MAG: hypothetical protein A3E42_04275 [Candidatus Gottesmanbacteria bacterium RIFCSPHIGHO2_12_FULL_40_13]
MIHKEIREKYISFFTTNPRNHKEIPSSPLIPENDPTVLFITAGMHPLVPYLMGEPHPLGKRLVNIQKSFRTDDIEEVGDHSHFTFFEMLGNWSLGDYFKKEAIEWSFDFLTSKDWLFYDPKKIYVSVFEGDRDAPRDEDSIRVWKEVYKNAGITAEIGDSKKGVSGNSRIFPYPKTKNWWGPAGTTGPCGPDSEMFYDTELPLHKKELYGPVCHINCDCGRYIEVWNDVFMEFNKNADGTYEPLKQKNVDTGMGMERVTALTSWLRKAIPEPDPFLTDLFGKSRYFIQQISNKDYEEPFKKSIRIILDHVRAVTFLIADGAEPGNKERGYVTRRLIRRAIRHGQILGIHVDFMSDTAGQIISNYREIYPEVKNKEEIIKSILSTEEVNFRKLLKKGLDFIEKQASLNGKIAFDLYQSFGFPPELTFEIAKERGIEMDRKTYEEEFAKHQEKSRTATKGVFKGGLQDHSEETKKLHTATHLLQKALVDVLGRHVRQKGSHITAERLRFDFSHDRKMTGEEIEKTEELVNRKIRENLAVTKETVKIEDALKSGALTVPGVKYPEKVTVYKMGNFSREVCGGPHVDFTGSLGKFKIIKEEAAGNLNRRIYAILSKT